MHSKYASLVVVASKVRSPNLLARLLRVAEGILDAEELAKLQRKSNAVYPMLKRLKQKLMSCPPEARSGPEYIAYKAKFDKAMSFYTKCNADIDSHNSAIKEREEKDKAKRAEEWNAERNRRK